MEKLISAITNTDKKLVLELVSEMIDLKEDPIKIIDALRIGMDKVGDKFEKGEYFLMQLVWAGEIFKDSMRLVKPLINKKGISAKGRFLIGTVRGDIHDLGKNIVVTLLESSGFQVLDIGVDVSPDAFVEKTKEFKPHIIGLSGLLTASIEQMRKTINALKMEGLREQVKVIVGGGVVGEDYVSDVVEADASVTSAVEGVKISEKFVKGG